MDFLDRLGIGYPIIQAPMAGVSTPSMAAAVSNGGGLGSLGLGASTVADAREMIEATKQLTTRPFGVNLFCHEEPDAGIETEDQWLDVLAPEFRRFGAAPPAQLGAIYQSFKANPDMLALLLANTPRVVSFHFGLPSPQTISALRAAGCLLLASATNLAEAQAIEAAGCDAVIAQGYEAGGHRGVFDPSAPDAALGTLVLTRLLVSRLSLPVIAAGGIMDGAAIRAALDLGAGAAQLGTAFIACTQSRADAAYRAALGSDAAHQTTMTRVISGRPARCLSNRFTALGALIDIAPPAYPRAYDAGKQLNAAARAAGETGYGAQWAGQGAPLHRAMPAEELLAALIKEADL